MKAGFFNSSVGQGERVPIETVYERALQQTKSALPRERRRCVLARALKRHLPKALPTP
jgi:hypothetical protein